MLARHGVIVVPGDDFHVPGAEPQLEGRTAGGVPGEVVLRLSYAAASPALIEAGIARLVLGIEDALN